MQADFVSWALLTKLRWGKIADEPGTGVPLKCISSPEDFVSDIVDKIKLKLFFYMNMGILS